ncbi:MAG: GNAT family N-acetyltransferase [Acutalibacteraceae bacterium]
MEKFFDVRFPLESDYEKLKALWKTAFDDGEESLDAFFKNTVSPERVLAVFHGDTPVSALYMLESEILFHGKTYFAYYIYGVCTHPDFREKGLMKSLFNRLFEIAAERNVDYLFLVPEEKYLFEVYRKQGFETGFFYSQKTLYKRDFESENEEKADNLTYGEYRKIISRNPREFPVAVLKESTFNSFFSSLSGEVKVIHIKNAGYALVEETAEQLTVFELFGDEKRLLRAVFQNTEKTSVIYRCKTNENSFPYGMYYKFGNVPKIENGFFGIPYST